MVSLDKDWGSVGCLILSVFVDISERRLAFLKLPKTSFKIIQLLANNVR
jgi:hypothetical protein